MKRGSGAAETAGRRLSYEAKQRRREQARLYQQERRKLLSPRAKQELKSADVERQRKARAAAAEQRGGRRFCSKCSHPGHDARTCTATGGLTHCLKPVEAAVKQVVSDLTKAVVQLAAKRQRAEEAARRRAEAAAAAAKEAAAAAKEAAAAAKRQRVEEAAAVAKRQRNHLPPEQDPEVQVALQHARQQWAERDLHDLVKSGVLDEFIES